MCSFSHSVCDTEQRLGCGVEIAVIDHISSMKTHHVNGNFDWFCDISAAVASQKSGHEKKYFAHLSVAAKKFESVLFSSGGFHC